MLIDVLQQTARIAHIDHKVCSGSQTCNHPQKLCPGNCECCIKEVHYPASYPGGRRTYDCHNMISYYACKFLAKYTSEIYYLVRKSQLIKNMKGLRILSLGCGPLPDLCAFEDFSYRQSQANITYCGIDNNRLWEPLHEMAAAYAFNSPYFGDCRFIYNDALQGLQAAADVMPDPDIFVLEYFISSIPDAIRPAYIASLFTYLTNLIINNCLKPCAIILTDYNHSDITDYFDTLHQNLALLPIFSVNILKYHYPRGVKSPYQVYGNPHPHDLIFPGLGNYLDLSFCNPWSYCTAAQMLIEIS